MVTVKPLEHRPLRAKVGKKCKQANKIRFRRTDALLAIANIKRNGNRESGHEEQRAYHCKHCGDWHLTSRPLRPR